MQDRPDLAELLDSVRLFLEEEVVPAVSDARLKFRARVASHVLSVAARERRQESPLLAAELTRLEHLVGEGSPPASGGDVRARLEVLNLELARAIREGSMDASPGTPVWGHLRLTAVEKLQVSNPAKLRARAPGGPASS